MLDGSAAAACPGAAADGLPVHPLADIFPLIEGAEFDTLTDDIGQNGLREPITLLDGLILDGRNRYRACMAAGVAPVFRTYDGADPVGFVVSLNLRRRHLTESQRGMVAAKLANLTAGSNQHTTGRANLPDLPEIAPAPPPVPVAQAAEMLSVSERTVKDARAVQSRGVPELVQAVERGRAPVSAAAAIARLPPETQREVAQRPKLPTAAEARSMAREQGVSVPARDGKLHDGRTAAEEKADAEASARAGCILHPLEEIIEADLTPAEYFAAMDVPRFGRFLDDDMGAAWAVLWPWFQQFNAIWEKHRAA